MALSINPNVSRDILVETQAATTREGFEESQTAMTRCMFNEKQRVRCQKRGMAGIFNKKKIEL